MKLIRCTYRVQSTWNPASCGRPRGHGGKHRRQPTKADIAKLHCGNGLQCLGLASCICICQKCKP